MNDQEKEEKESSDDSQVEHPPKKPSALEWALAGLGLLLIVSVLGFIIYRAQAKNDNPPNFSFEEVKINPSGDKFLVTFKIKNSGDETAAAVVVEGELKRGDEKIEDASASVAYVPAHSSREAGLLFTKNPNDFSLELNAKGYEKP